MTTLTEIKPKFDVYQMATDRIINLIETSQTLVWRKTWKDSNLQRTEFAKNLTTMQEYNGINRLLLNLAGFEIPYFITFNQCRDLGGNVKKGAKSLPVFFFSHGEKMNEQGENEKFGFWKYYNVFNVQDCEGLKYPTPEIIAPGEETQTIIKNGKIGICESIVENYKDCPAIVSKTQSRCYYSVNEDFVSMPDLEIFNDSESYYATLFHELAHSTGNEKRLNRDMKNGFGSDKYAKEELIAEFTASFLCDYTGINNAPLDENCAAYLQNWVKRFKEDKKLLLSSASMAQRAADYILSK